MNGRIGLIAAVPQELKPLLTHKSASRWRKTLSGGGLEVWEYPHPGGCWIAAWAGMGEAAVSRAFAAAEKNGVLDCVATVGFAGATDATLCRGVYGASQIVNAKTGERYRPAYWDDKWPVLVSVPSVADAAEKRRLHEAYAAGLVDMEAATIARLAESRGIPFYCFKAVSDEAGETLPDVSRFIGSDGQLRTIQFIARSMLRPSTWPVLISLAKSSKAAAASLAETIYDWIDERAHIRKEVEPANDR